MPIPIGAILGTIGAVSQLAQGGPPSFDRERARKLREASEGQQRYLQQMQAGKGPSLGRVALQQGLQQATSQQQAMAASARGGPLQQRLAQRTSQMAGAQMAGRANQAAARLRVQEQLGATQQLQQNLSQQQAHMLREQRARTESNEARRHFTGDLVGGLMETYQDPYLHGGNV